MTSLKKLFNYTGIAIFLVTFAVFYMSAERVGSLWDCGEFILGAQKLQVVHPPGAPLFLLIGRMFTWVASIFSTNPSDVAFAVNLMSGMSTSLAAVFAGWTTMMFGKLGMVGREGETSSGQNIALALGGLVAGLSTAFASSIWFSAVEGEVYAMSTMFTALTYWAAVKWYYLPDNRDSDRWLVLCLFAAGLSIGVHLLSLLTFPAIGLLYYFKKYKEHSILGYLLAMAAGVGMIVFVQKIIIVGIPTIWKNFEVPMVNGGLPVHSGIVPTVLLLAGLSYATLRYAHKNNKYLLQLFAVSSILITIAFSTIGTVVIRANADTPVNMNVPSDATRLLPYLNREQYGERPLLMGPTYDAKPKKVNKEDRYGLVEKVDALGNKTYKYEYVDEKYTYEYANKDKIFFPRVGHSESSRPALHRMWREQLNGNSRGKPGMGYNLQFLTKYQLSWMYGRYFMWNFVGKQNGDQGYYPWDKRDGHWRSGIQFLDEAKLFNMEEMPESMANNKADNTYYFLPLIFGLLGFLWHVSRSKQEFFSLLIMFILTGIGIIIYSNQPPNEPRERDYIFAGSFMAFAMWIGMGVYAIYGLIADKAKNEGVGVAALAGVLVLSAPVIMGFQNFDDHSRAEIKASRDYAANFLNSVEENAILFTYGDNDTYPLWYAQEVEGIRTDVRVVNLSLIAVDWYINKLRNKVNDSPPIKLTLKADDIRGKKRNQIFFFDPRNRSDQKLNNPLPLDRALQFIASPDNMTEGQTYLPSKRLFLPINPSRIASSPVWANLDSMPLAPKIDISFPENKGYITKDDLAILDIIANNFYDRPIYFATTCKNEKLLGLNDYMQLEGLALRIVPSRTKSDPSLAIYGSGRADVDILYDHIMNDWKWGNFDKVDLFVDKNYMAEIQAMKMAMLRTSAILSQSGDDKRAADVANKYFEAFPHMNFAYDTGVVPFINVLVKARDFDAAKKHLQILGTEVNQYMNFYESLDEDDLQSFRQDMSFYARGVDDIIALAKEVEDPDFAKQIEDLLSVYSLRNIQG